MHRHARPALIDADLLGGRMLAEALERWRGVPDGDQWRLIWHGDGEFVPSAWPAGGRIRVGLWCPCLGLGGAEAWQLALARSVDPARVAWAGAAVLEGRGASDPRMAGELSTLMPVGYGLDAAQALAAASDVVVSWAVTDVASLLRGLDPPPGVVLTCHFPAESPWGPGTAGMLAGVDRLVAVSSLAMDSIPRPERSRASVIWNAVDPSRLKVVRGRAEVRASWGVPTDVPVAGYLGRLSPEKDPDAMLRLAPALPEPWHVVLVGEGRERAALSRRAEDLGSGRVRLVGGDPAAGDVLNAFDALVVPSHYESFGLTMAEGLWSGVPVVATPVGLAKLVPGLTRTVAASAGGEELAAAVLADAADPRGTADRVARARAFASDRLAPDRFGREWTDLIVEMARREVATGATPGPEGRRWN